MPSTPISRGERRRAARAPGHGAVWLAALLFTALACGPRIPPLRQADLLDWTEVEAPGLRLVGRIDSQELQRLARELDLFIDTVRKFVPVAGDRTLAPVTLYCFADPDLVAVFHSQFVAGQMLPALDGFFGTVSVSGRYFQTRQVLFHEYTHFVLRADHRFAYPAWFEEGVAEYFSTLRVRDDAVLLGAPPSDRVGWVVGRGMAPLERVLEPGQDWETVGDALDFYATSWLLVHFLMSSQPGREDLSDFVDRLRRGEAPKSAALHAIRWPLGVLEPRVRAHGRRLAAGAPAEFFFDAGDFAGPTRVRERGLSPGVVGYELGELARRLDAGEGGRGAKAAQRFFDLGLELGAGDARLRAARAEVLAILGSPDAARAELALGLAEGRRDPAVWVHAGRTRVRLAGEGESAPGAEEAFRSAVALAPRAPIPHAELGALLREAGRLSEARESLERAWRLGAWSPELDLELAVVYLGLGEQRHARRLLRPLAGYPHSEKIAEEARRLLSGL